MKHQLIVEKGFKCVNDVKCRGGGPGEARFKKNPSEEENQRSVLVLKYIWNI